MLNLDDPTRRWLFRACVVLAVASITVPAAAASIPHDGVAVFGRAVGSPRAAGTLYPRPATVLHDTLPRGERLSRHDTTFTCPSGAEMEVARYTDRGGRIRRLVTQGGTDDHGESVRYDYDTAGRLRFVFAKFSAVNGAVVEERVWLSTAGRELRRIRRLVHGPGYPFEPVRFVRDPRRWRTAVCP